MREVKIVVTKKNVEFYLDNLDYPIKLMFQNILPNDVRVIWADETSHDQRIYLEVGPHKSQLFDLDKVTDALKEASEIKNIFLEYLNDMLSWYESIPTSITKFEIN
jgi:hypothetical protein